MALARCLSCGSPQGTKQTYIHPHGVMYPARILCGSQNCTSWAMVWLTDAEELQYVEGTRVFRVSNRGVGVELSESPYLTSTIESPPQNERELVAALRT